MCSQTVFTNAHSLAHSLQPHFTFTSLLILLQSPSSLYLTRHPALVNPPPDSILRFFAHSLAHLLFSALHCCVLDVCCPRTCIACHLLLSLFVHVRVRVCLRYRFLVSLQQHPELIRNIVVAGHLHHGKTEFMDLLVQQTHPALRTLDKETRYTDTRMDEQQRGLSIKSTPMSLLLSSTREKSYLFNLIDTPGSLPFLFSSFFVFPFSPFVLFSFRFLSSL